MTDNMFYVESSMYVAFDQLDNKIQTFLYICKEETYESCINADFENAFQEVLNILQNIEVNLREFHAKHQNKTIKNFIGTTQIENYMVLNCDAGVNPLAYICGLTILLDKSHNMFLSFKNNQTMDSYNIFKASVDDLIVFSNTRYLRSVHLSNENLVSLNHIKLESSCFH